MKRIVIPTDFSENAMHAIRYCHKLFSGEKLEVVLLHTFGADVYTSAATMGLRADTSAMDQHLRDTERKLTGLKETLEGAFTEADIHYETVARYDFLPDAINFLISQGPVYLVAMGTKGATGAREILLGSNAVRIMEKVTGVPVLAIPENCHIKAPRKIALATAYTDLPEKSQLKTFIDIATACDAEVTMIHISDEVRLNEKEKMNRNWLQDELEVLDPALYTLDNKAVEEAIMDYVENTRTEMIAIISRHHGFFQSLLKRSTLKDLGYHSKVPLFVMHHQ